MREAGLEEVEAYVLRRKNKVVQYIATRLILDICEEAVQRTGTRAYKRWWEKEGLGLEGVQEVTSEVEVVGKP